MNLLIKPVWILVENLVQNEIGHEAYGSYSSLFSFVLIFSVLADWGISNFSTQQIAEDKEKYRSIYNSLFFVRILILVVYPIIMVGLGWLFKYNLDELKLLAVIALTQTFVYFLMFFRAKFQAFQNFKTDGFMSVIERVILLFIVVILLQKGLTLSLFVNARLMAIVITVLISFTVVTKLYGFIKLKFSKKDIQNTLKAAFPFTLVTLLYSFNERIDMVMLERMFSKHEAGLYAGAYRFYDAFMMFVWLIMPIFFSKFAKAKGEGSGASKLFNNGFLMISIPMLMITPFLFFDGNLLFFLFSKSSELEVFRMNRLFQLLVISLIFNSFFVIMGTFLNASGHVKKVNWIILISALINVTLNYAFIPKYGAYAAGVSTAISTGLLGIGYLVLVMQSKLRIDLKNIIGVFISFVVGFAVYFISKMFILDSWYFGLFFSTITFILTLYPFGIFNRIKLEFNG